MSPELTNEWRKTHAGNTAETTTRISMDARRFRRGAFSTAIMLVSFSAMICLAFRVYNQLPKTELRLVYFFALYLVAAALYINIGVWIHEQLHCLAFQGPNYEKRVQIVYKRKYILILNGHYRVIGAIDYQVMRRALLGPLILVAGFLVVGWLGSFILPGWWFPILGTLAVASALDMTHDFYWLSQIRRIGRKGKYWDNGHEMEVVWKA